VAKVVQSHDADRGATVTGRVVLVHLGRVGGMGTWKRIDGLRAIFEGAGAEVDEIKLRVDHRPQYGDLLRPGLGAVLRGRAVPESLAWSHESVRRRLETMAPDLVWCCTSRAYHPRLIDERWAVVLDFIDRLSVSYRDRATVKETGPKRFGFRLLSPTNARFEHAPLPPGSLAVAAGWADARDLGATWVPITLDTVDAIDEADPQHDLLFFGNLSYPPNVEAVARLDRLWPALVRRRPGTTMVIGGANPAPSVTDAVARHGWVLHRDFAAVGDLLRLARVSVVPLEHASGIQIKVLEAAAFGRPQVLSPAARAGLGPDFPAVVAGTDGEVVTAVTDLLDDPGLRAQLGAEAHRHMRDRFSHAAWIPWAEELLVSQTRPPVPPAAR
jgi:glycosyltransferase involved in cell wall biosynthesis